MTGTIYLLHFSKPYYHVRHYIGWTTNLTKRLAQHRKGQGARLLQVIIEHGITFTLARTWIGDRHLERKLKNRHNAPKLCPICRKESNE